ncbi:MAG: hypothetical protein QXW70_02525 [Candidatus Anstonellales archaeon]
MAFKQKSFYSESLSGLNIDLKSVPVKTEREKLEVIYEMRRELTLLADIVEKRFPDSMLAKAIKKIDMENTY